MVRVIGVDVGNSATKIGIPQENDQWSRQIVRQIDESFTPELSIECTYLWSVCSVNQSRSDELQKWVALNRSQDRFEIIDSDQVPIESHVDSRKQVGRDRLVACWAAWDKYREDLVVVDAGTAVTVDYIDRNGVFQGGMIFPGAESSLKLLSETTHDLPSLNVQGPEMLDTMRSLIGKNTRSAIMRGVYHAQRNAIIQLAEQIAGRATRVVATGGQIERMERWLPSSWSFDRYLVLRGAAAIGRSQLLEDEK